MAESFTLHSGLLYGFEKLHIFLYTGSTPEYYVLEGKDGAGATQKIELEGLSKEPTGAAGSDGTYYQARKGVGKVSANLTLFDVPHEVENKMLGRVTTTDGITLIGKDTEAPEAAIIAETHTVEGEPIYIAVLRGVFRRDKLSTETIDPNEEFKPEGAEYVFSGQVLKSDDPEMNGQSVGSFIGDGAGKDRLFKVLGYVEPTTPTSDPNAA